MCHFKARIASLLVTTTAINMIPTQGTARIEFFEKVPKVNASTRTILVTFFLKVILRFISHLETILRTIFSENNCQIQNSLQTENKP